MEWQSVVSRLGFGRRKRSHLQLEWEQFLKLMDSKKKIKLMDSSSLSCDSKAAVVQDPSRLLSYAFASITTDSKL